MEKLLTNNQIREWDTYTIETEGIDSIDLMEHAARQCTHWIIKRYMRSVPMHVFCGIGNNGGDGLAIARQLSEFGFHCTIYCAGDTEKATQDFKVNMRKLSNYPIEIVHINSEELISKLTIAKEEIIIDALLGTGTTRPLEGLLEKLVIRINNSMSTILSVDIPSGMMNCIPESTVETTMISANYTLTFQCMKLPFLFNSSGDYAGNVIVLPIGLSGRYLNSVNSNYFLLGANDILPIIPQRNKFGHKGSYGHCTVVAGSKGKYGAAILCASACLRSGSGLVFVVCPESGLEILQSSIPEAMVHVNKGRDELSGDCESLTQYVAIGPGIGTSNETGNFLSNILQKCKEGIVLDADGLNLVALNPRLRKLIPKESILTPHPKELERWIGRWQSEKEKLEKLALLSIELESYIILKGAHSVMVGPDGNYIFNTTGNPGMSTGGSGDVLTGIIAGLLAQGLSSKEACMVGMYIHGLAGDLAAKDKGMHGMIAGDIIDYLPMAFLEVQRNCTKAE